MSDSPETLSRLIETFRDMVEAVPGDDPMRDPLDKIDRTLGMIERRLADLVITLNEAAPS